MSKAAVIVPGHVRANVSFPFPRVKAREWDRRTKSKWVSPHENPQAGFGASAAPSAAPAAGGRRSSSACRQDTPTGSCPRSLHCGGAGSAPPVSLLTGRAEHRFLGGFAVGVPSWCGAGRVPRLLFKSGFHLPVPES